MVSVSLYSVNSIFFTPGKASDSFRTDDDFALVLAYAGREQNMSLKLFYHRVCVLSITFCRGNPFQEGSNCSRECQAMDHQGAWHIDEGMYLVVNYV